MVNLFLGYPGDGKTTNLFSYCLRDESVSRNNKIIITDDTYNLAGSEKIKLFAGFCDIKARCYKNISQIDIEDIKMHDQKIYFDSCSHNSFLFYRKYFNQYPNLEMRYILVIDICRLYFWTDKDLEDLNKFNDIIFTKYDLVSENFTLCKQLNKITQRLPVGITCYISDGPIIPSALKKLETKEGIINV